MPQKKKKTFYKNLTESSNIQFIYFFVESDLK